MKDHKAILGKYQFTDALGHPLETCQDYLDLLAEHKRMREALEYIITFEPSREGYIKGKSFNEIHDAARAALRSLEHPKTEAA